MVSPLVSIGIPTYNRPQKLERAIKSLLDQTYSNLEIIVSDNGSPTKEVETVMAKFSNDKRIKFYQQDSNRGIVYNFNFLVQKFSGDYFMRIGDDDWLDNNYIIECLTFLQNNTEFSCAYGRTRLYTLNNEFLKYDPELDVQQSSYSNRMIFYYQTVTQNGPYFGVMRKDFIQFCLSKNRLADDWLLIGRLCFQGKIKMLTTTHLNISQGGLGESTSGFVQTLGLPKFNRFFPYFSILKNVYFDIVWHSKIYKKISLLNRLTLAKACAHVIYRRFNVKKEVKDAYKEYLKATLLPHQSMLPANKS